MRETFKKITETAFSMAGVCLVLALAPVQAHAAELIWDNGSGDSLWNTTSTNWSGTATWSNSVPDNATFTATGAGAVTLGEAITAGTVGINAGAYTFSGSGLTVTGLIDVASGNDVTINNIVGGDGTLSHTGSGLLMLAGNNTFTGGVSHSAGTLRIANNNGFGTGPVVLTGGSLQAQDSRTIPNEIKFSGTSALAENTSGNRFTAFSGTVNLNQDNFNITPGINREVHFSGTLNGTASYVNLGRNITRIRSGTTVNYAGEFRLYRSGPSASIFEIGDGMNLANNIRINDNGNFNDAKIIRLISGATSAEYSGDIYLVEDTDGVFDISARPGETITVSGAISEDSDGTGVDIIGGGTVILTGTNTYKARTSVQAGTLLINGDNAAATGAVNVQTNATLGGIGSIGGNVVVNNGSVHSPGSNGVGVQNCLAAVSYNTGSKVFWQLGANSATNRGTAFDGIDVGGDLSFDTAVALELKFNQAGSTVEWTDGFWSVNRQWLVWDVAGTTTNFEALNLTVADWEDANGLLFDTVRPKSSFTLVESSGGISLKYEAPLQGTVILVN